MAWTARIDSIADAANGADLRIGVTYFDAADTNLVSPLATQAFAFAANTPVADMRAMVVTWGQGGTERPDESRGRPGACRHHDQRPLARWR